MSSSGGWRAVSCATPGTWASAEPGYLEPDPAWRHQVLDGGRVTALMAACADPSAPPLPAEDQRGVEPAVEGVFAGSPGALDAPLADLGQVDDEAPVVRGMGTANDQPLLLKSRDLRAHRLRADPLRHSQLSRRRRPFILRRRRTASEPAAGVSRDTGW
jgi:hypothetical protein